jgi:putative peptidoglycan lipid II flippase
MLKRIRGIENNFSLGKAAAFIGILSLLSRLLGFYRQYLFASSFGLSDTLDIYIAAFRIPDTIFNLLILGTLSAAFIPVFSQYYLKNKQQAFEIANSILNFSFLVMLVICGVAFIFASPLTHLLVPGFDPDKLQQTVFLTRILLVSPIIFTISNIFSSILLSFKRFIAVNIAALFYNAGIIFGLIFLYPNWGMAGLGIGVIIGALLHALIQLPELIHQGWRFSFILKLKSDGVKKILTLFIPRIFGLDISFVSLLIASFIGSYLAEGSIAAYTLANDLQALPIGIFAISTATALFPLLSENFAKNDHESFIKNLERGMLQVLIFIIPISIWMLLFRAQIVRIIYGHGKIDWNQTILLFNTFGVFTIALFSQALAPLLARAFYARQNTKIPLIIGLCSFVINAVSSYIFSLYFGVVGMVIGFCLASFCNTVLLFIFLRLDLSKQVPQNLIHDFDSNILKQSLKIIFAAGIAGLVSYSYLYLVAPFLNTKTVIGLITQIGLSGLAGLVVYLILLYLLKNPMVKSLINKISF